MSQESRFLHIPTEIIVQLQNRNQRHFGQAAGTPFTIPPLANELGFPGEGTISDLLLKGEHKPSNTLSDSTRILLEHLKQTSEMARIPRTPVITAASFIVKLKVWLESTTTSPSGIHLGHYKALIAQHSYTHITDDDDTDEDGVPKLQLRDELNHMQNAFLCLHLQLINYALTKGYSFSR